MGIIIILCAKSDTALETLLPLAKVALMAIRLSMFTSINDDRQWFSRQDGERDRKATGSNPGSTNQLSPTVLILTVVDSSSNPVLIVGVVESVSNPASPYSHVGGLSVQTGPYSYSGGLSGR